MNDRRFDLRIQVANTVSICWTDQTGQEQQGQADLADISRSGAAIHAQHPVRVGTTLAFSYQDQELRGKVTHCVSGASGYALGIEFEDGYRWSPGKR